MRMSGAVQQEKKTLTLLKCEPIALLQPIPTLPQQKPPRPNPGQFIRQIARKITTFVQNRFFAFRSELPKM